MGLFNKLANLSSKPIEKIEIVFNETFIDQISSISSARAELSVSFPEDLMQEIDKAVEQHIETPRVPYDEEMQFLDVVGESFHQESLRELHEEYGEHWFAGFLLPEPFNQFDPNAVMVLAINPTDYSVVQVGHLAKEQAKKVQKKIIKLLINNKYVPIIMLIKGGEPDKPNYGILARSKTKKITF